MDGGPNLSPQPTALSWQFARWVELATGVIGGYGTAIVGSETFEGLSVMAEV